MQYSDTDQSGFASSENSRYVHKPLYDFGKRLVETTVAVLILVMLSPVWLVVALTIKLTSEGPVIYKGKVVGKGGREFTYYKFRSMSHKNDNSSHRSFIANYVKSEHQHTSADSAKFKLVNDDRVTAVGKLIRKLSIDEVPQMVNVIRGEMAIVGPRPPVPYEFELYDNRTMARLLVLPGITGLAQVKARGKCSFREMVEIDLEYIGSRSLLLDLKIMLKTPIIMLKGA